MKRITSPDRCVHITLSRRNILPMLKMLDNTVGEPSLHRQIGQITLLVQAEEDTVHYTARNGMGIGPDDVPSNGVDRLQRGPSN